MSKPATKQVSVSDEKFQELKALLERANDERPNTQKDPLLKRIFDLFDGMVMRGVSQEKAAYVVASVFAQALSGNATGDIVG